MRGLGHQTSLTGATSSSSVRTPGPGEAAQKAAESSRSNPGNTETMSVEVEVTVESPGGILSRTPPRGSKKATYSKLLFSVKTQPTVRAFLSVAHSHTQGESSKTPQPL